MSATRSERIASTLSEMATEAQRALDKHGPQNTMDAPSRDDGYRLAILMEEVGEVAGELTYDKQGVKLIRDTKLGWSNYELENTPLGICVVLGDDTRQFIDEMDDEHLADFGWRRETAQQRLRKELIQVGAMAATWAAMLG